MRYFLVSCAAWMLLVAPSNSQDSTAPVPPQDTSKQSDAADERSGRVVKVGGQAPREEHVIYVPYTKLPEVFEKEGASVLLPYAQFLRLWSGAPGAIVPLPIKPPVAGLISRADYVGKVEGDLVRLQTTLTVEVLGDDWARLPIRFGEAAVGESHTDDEHVLLRGVGDGTYELLAHGRGQHKISFELVASVQSSADGKSFTVHCPSVGVSNLELEIPETDLAVQVAPRRTSQVRRQDETTSIQAALGATDKFTVTWQPKSGAAAEMAGLATVSDTITVELGDGVVHTHAIFDYQILRGSVDNLSVTIPASERLLDVQAAGLRDWQSEPVEGQPGRQQLTVRLHAASRDRVRLEIRTESPIPDQSFTIAQLQAVGVSRESGIVAVRSAEDVGIEFVTHTGVSRIDASEAPEPLRKPRTTFYKFFSPSFELAVDAVLLEPRVSAESFLTVTIDKARVNTRGEFKFDVTRAGIFAVPFRLPSGFYVDEVQCESMDRHEISNDEAGQLLTVFLTKKVIGALKVVIAASQPRVAQNGELELPLIEPVGVPREQGLVAVIAPESIEVNSDPAKLESARAATPAEMAARGFHPQPVAGSTIAASFSFARRPVRIELATRQRPRRMLGTVSTTASVKEDIVSVTSKLNFDIQFAGIDRLRFAVPAGVDRPQIDGEGIKEKRSADESDPDGATVWTVVLHSEAIGQRSITVSYDEKISVPENGVTKAIRPIRLMDVDRETGEVSILKDRSLSITATASGLEEIDPRELTLPVSTQQPYLCYRYFRHPATLTLAVTKHEIEGVVRTVISRAFVEAVVGSDGPISVRARYWIKSSERQRLAVTLPALRVLAVTVAGRNVLPEKAQASPGAAADERAYFINIDRQSGPDEAFPVAIIYEAAAPPGEKLAITGDLTLRLPQFEKGVKFQQLFVRLWLPDRYRAIGEPAGFTAETRSVFVGLDYQQRTRTPEEPESWFPGDGTSFDFRTAGHSSLYSSLNPPRALSVRYWKTAPMNLAGSLAIFVVGFALVFVRLEAKVFVLLAAILGTIVAGMFWPEAMVNWLAAARMGVAAVIALWLVVFLLRVRRTSPFQAAAAGVGTVLLSTVAGSAATMPPGPPPPHVDQPSAPDEPSQSSPSDHSSNPQQEGGANESQ